jgi:hypothetical protein
MTAPTTTPTTASTTSTTAPATGFDPVCAFGTTDPAFARRVKGTLDALRGEAALPALSTRPAQTAPSPARAKAPLAAQATRPSRAPSHLSRRRPVRALLVAAALAVALVGGSAFALTSGFGLFSQLSGPYTGTPLPEAEELLQTGVAQQGGAFEQATFTLDELLYDGRKLWLSVRVRPNSPQYVLTCSDSLAQDAKALLNERAGGQEPPAQQTLSAWAAENGYTPLYTAVYHLDTAGSAVGSVDMRFLSDGSIVHLLRLDATGLEPGQKLELVCSLTPFAEPNGATIGEIDKNRQEESVLSFTLDDAQPLPLRVAANSQPVEFAAAGIVVDSLTLSASPVSTYYEIEFTVVDAEAFGYYDGGLFFRLLDENGKEYLSGLGGDGELGIILGTEDRYRQSSAIQALAEMPASIQLQLFDLTHGKQVVGTQSVELS